ncbi:alpha/beta hydrolase [Metabacillus malikii]|uniref:Esterase/lipase n=1 Tax=Metabacillus malikii TaxID=1504265 RepID=A0ABT9ZL30_9BACI|nr:alpha/beta fold hydrolase [Metabacillus malikii]MDQ0232492.1 esterase/lipase [Metabacillus malikii]
MIGCLFIHGFTGAPYEVEPLAKDIEEKMGWVVKVPTLPGHGVTLSLKGHTYNEWVAHAEQELITLMDEVDEVYVIGFSMGGIIASYLAAKYKVKKLVLLSAAAYYINPKQLLLDCLEVVRDAWRGQLKQNELYVRYRTKLRNTPIKATREFQKLVKMVRPILKDLTVPVLIIQGERDGIVPVKSAHFLYKTIPSPMKELKLLPSSKHHICYGDDYEELRKHVEEFLSDERSLIPNSLS